ncbi:HupE/UreJ family protein [Paenibacillus psychroresistens]|uniref:HupE/UreJ family protein n=1 Tax=Paenibacillus psychroresistens TaxID=1778678 RepID=A0A6B8RV16_9BACL|nr:HupE/UreJ family protein [Paenibacillus psychroresistens]QGQ99273.1 HupE/UreJ family protein [Paenibacillus psychroresistens]
MIRNKVHIMRMSLIFMVLVMVMLLHFKQTVYAHAYSASYTTLNLTQSETEMIYTLDELSVIELMGGDINADNKLDQEEFNAVKARMEATLKENLTLKINEEIKAWTQLISLDLGKQGDTTKLILKAIYPPAAPSKSISLLDTLYTKDAKTNYVNLLTINYGSQKGTEALSGNFRTWSLMVTDKDYTSFPPNIQQLHTGEQTTNEESEPTNSTSGWYSFFKLGMGHILSGYDHLLFLFSLLIARQTLKQYATMITAFTIAHSCTLTLTVLGIINVSPMIVEPAIALSICYVALDNIARPTVSHRWVLTFLFGLIHGMGFADILKEMNIPKSELAVDLISFNLGIETVQITIVTLLVPLLYLLHRYQHSRRFVVVGSSIALVLGGIWLIERLVTV